MMNILKSLPVAKFFYQGNHTHPVRRTVLLVENTPKYLLGYEIRAGNEIFDLQTASLKRYNKSGIAKIGDYSRLRNRKNSRNLPANQTTLVRMELRDVINNV